VVVLPFVNSALAARTAFLRSVEALRCEGIRVLLGHGEFEPHAAGSGGDRFDTYPWHRALQDLEHMPSPMRA
jgi:hypothetical protein